MHALSYRTIAVAVCAALVAGPTASAAVTQSFQQTGNLDVEFVAVGTGNTGLVNGSLNLTNTIGPAVKAYVYAADFGIVTTPDLIFGGLPIGGNVVTTDTLLNGTMMGYRWDVTNHVVGAGNYSFVIGQNTQGNQITTAGLVVVYNDLSAATRQVTIHDGIEQVGYPSTSTDTKSYTFNNLLAGPTDVWLLSGFDSFNVTAPPSFESGETVTWNGTNVGGPLDAAQGLNATLTNGMATSTAGSNTLTVNTGATPVDNFGVIAAVSLVTVVPEPAGIAISLGLIAIAGVRRPRYPVGHETLHTRSADR